MRLDTVIRDNSVLFENLAQFEHEEIFKSGK